MQNEAMSLAILWEKLKGKPISARDMKFAFFHLIKWVLSTLVVGHTLFYLIFHSGLFVSVPYVHAHPHLFAFAAIATTLLVADTAIRVILALKEGALVEGWILYGLFVSTSLLFAYMLFTSHEGKAMIYSLGSLLSFIFYVATRLTESDDMKP